MEDLFVDYKEIPNLWFGKTSDYLSPPERQKKKCLILRKQSCSKILFSKLHLNKKINTISASSAGSYQRHA
jgi:non-homologous end joining protein Ku